MKIPPSPGPTSHRSTHTKTTVGRTSIRCKGFFDKAAISHCRDIALRELRGKLLRELKREKSRPQLERLAKDSRPSMSETNRVTIAEEATRQDKRLNYFSD